MRDTPHNRRKMVHYILGMQYVIRSLRSDDDPLTFIEDQNEDIKAIKADWNISAKDLAAARKYMNGIK